MAETRMSGHRASGRSGSASTTLEATRLTPLVYAGANGLRKKRISEMSST